MKKYLFPAVSLLLILALALSLGGCSMGLNEMLIVKRAYRHVAGMDSLSFTVEGQMDAAVASIPIKAQVDADCRCIIDPGALYMDMEADLGKLGTFPLPVYLYTQDDSLILSLGVGLEGRTLWFSSDIPLSQGGESGGSLDVETVLTLLQDDPEALSIGDSETLNGVLCRPFILKIPGSMLMDALGSAASESGSSIDDIMLTVWIAEEDGSPVRLSTDAASLIRYMLEKSDSSFASQLEIKSLPVTVDITGFNNVDSIDLPRNE